MGFSRDEGKTLRVIRARTYKPLCSICLKPIFAGEEYVTTCGSRINKCGVAHVHCYIEKGGNP